MSGRGVVREWTEGEREGGCVAAGMVLRMVAMLLSP